MAATTPSLPARGSSPSVAETPPPDWFHVKEVSDWYSFYIDKVKAKRAEREILTPLGLTRETFISRQKELSADLVNKIAYDLVNYRLPGTSAIITGIDRRGPHIFSVNNGAVVCQDAGGFAAIGVGSYHANSYMMFARHSRDATVSQTLLRTLAAKKRAEVAPGVGAESDMFIIGSGLGSYNILERKIIDDTEKIYQASVKSHAATDKRAEVKAHEYVQEIIKQRTQPAKQVSPDASNAEPFPPKETPPE